MRASWGFCFRTWPFCHFTAASRPRVCHCISLPIPACKTPAKPLQFPLTKALTKLCAVPLDHMTNLASQPARNKENKDHKYASIDPPIPIQRLLAAFCGLRITFFRENQRRNRCWCRCWWWARSRRKMMVNNFQSARQSCKRPNTNPLAPRTNQFAI